MNLPERIRELRIAKRVTQIQVSDKLQIDRPNYARLEKRGKKLTVEQLEKIADALGVSFLDLLNPDATIESMTMGYKAPQLLEVLPKNEIEQADARIRELLLKNGINSGLVPVSISFQSFFHNNEVLKTYTIEVGGIVDITTKGDTLKTALQRFEIDFQMLQINF
jgi:transcriptional regulator with XRE-family HTH domain